MLLRYRKGPDQPVRRRRKNLGRAWLSAAIQTRVRPLDNIWGQLQCDGFARKFCVGNGLWFDIRWDRWLVETLCKLVSMADRPVCVFLFRDGVGLAHCHDPYPMYSMQSGRVVFRHAYEWRSLLRFRSACSPGLWAFGSMDNGLVELGVASLGCSFGRLRPRFNDPCRCFDLEAQLYIHQRPYLASQ